MIIFIFSDCSNMRNEDKIRIKYNALSCIQYGERVYYNVINNKSKGSKKEMETYSIVLYTLHRILFELSYYLSLAHLEN